MIELAPRCTIPELAARLAVSVCTINCDLRALRQDGLDVRTKQHEMYEHAAARRQELATLAAAGPLSFSEACRRFGVSWRTIDKDLAALNAQGTPLELVKPTAWRRREVAKRVDAGQTRAEIVAELGITVGQVRHAIARLRDEGVELRLVNERQRRGEALRKKIIELRGDGLTKQQIAQELGTSENYVRKVIKRMRKTGVEVPPWNPDRRRPAVANRIVTRRNEIARLLAETENITEKELARRLGVSTETVRTDLRAISVNPPLTRRVGRDTQLQVTRAA